MNRKENSRLTLRWAPVYLARSANADKNFHGQTVLVLHMMPFWFRRRHATAGNEQKTLFIESPRNFQTEILAKTKHI